MGAKIITIWGSPGSGKSILAISLAAVIAEKSQNVIVFNGDKIVPALKMYCPNEVIDSKKSVGPLLLSGRFDDVDLAERLVIHPQSQYVSFLGMAPSDTYISYNKFERANTIQMVNKMAPHADYVIIDGTSNPFEDTMTMIGLEMSDVIIRCITADVRGVLFLDAARTIYRETKFRFDDHIPVLGNVHTVSPVSEVMSVSGQYDYILGYSPEIENKYIAGELMKDYKTSSAREFEKQVRKLAGGIVG